MSKKRENFIERHLDKIVLGLIGLVSVGLLWVFVFRNPFGPVIDGRKESPSSAQSRLVQKAERLRERIEGRSDTAVITPPDYVSSFERLLSCSVPSLSQNVFPLTPGIGRQPIESDREYAVPEIPALEDVQMALIRSAAYVPTEEVTPEIPYEMVPTQIGDIDFITISARLDVRRIVQQFQSAFMGLGVRPAHQDPVLATPVAARLEIQRREQMEDGSWGAWERVSIPQTVAYRKIFEQLPERVEDLPPGGVQIQIEQYKDRTKQVALLQQRPYDFATSRYQYWMPPSYLEEVQKLIQQQQDEARRAQQTQQTQPETGMPMGGRRIIPEAGRREIPTPTPTPTQPARRPRGAARPGAEMEMTPETPMGVGGGMERPTRPGVRQRTVEDVYRDYLKELLVDDWWKRTEPLLIWAHDDTAKPGKTYQYRMRIGFFNPIAGKDWFKPNQQEFKNQVVLWSPFAETLAKKKEPLLAVVPKKLHIFPMDISKTDPTAVQVQVSKFYLGRWRSEKFEVLPGQVIGTAVEVKKTSTLGVEAGGAALGMAGGMPMPVEGGGLDSALSETIDFTTPYVYIDQNAEIDWSGTAALRRREFMGMLYTQDVAVFEKLPIRQPNWSQELRKIYREIQDAEREAENEIFIGRTPPPQGLQTPGGLGPAGVPGMMVPGGFMGREG